LVVVIVPVLVAVILLTLLGQEAHSARFGRAPEPAFASDRFTRAPAGEPAPRIRT
jgi:hypothetical protein